MKRYSDWLLFSLATLDMAVLVSNILVQSVRVYFVVIFSSVYSSHGVYALTSEAYVVKQSSFFSRVN